MSDLRLKLSYLLSASNTTKSRIQFCDNRHYAYISGSALVVCNLTDHSQRFVVPKSSASKITYFTFSLNREYIAVVESEKCETISVYEYPLLKRKKQIQNLECYQTTQLESLGFSHDSKLLAVLAKDGGGQLAILAWESATLVVTIEFRTLFSTSFLTEVYFNPLDASSLSVVSGGQFRLLTLTGASLKVAQTPKLIPSDIVCHVWISPYRYVAGTKNGCVFVVDKGEIRAEIKISDFLTSVASDNQPITAIAPHSEVGFCCLFGHTTVVILEAIDKAGLSYRKLCEITLKGTEEGKDASRYGVQVNMNRTLLVASVEGRFWMADLKNLTLVKGGIVTSDVIPVNGHRSSVVRVSTCAWRAFVATCGQDKRLCVWNMENGSLVSELLFREEILSASFHPFGLHVAVSLDSSLPIVATRVDGLKISRELSLRRCSLLAFSPGGHILAATQGNAIKLISFTSLEVIFTLLGHKGLVSGLSWFSDNRRLVTCGTGGSANIWDSTTGELLSQVRVRHTSLQAIDLVSNHLLYAISSEGALLEMNNGKTSDPMSLQGATVDSVIGAAELEKLITGTSTGSITVLSCPMGDKPSLDALVDTRVHLQPVSTMCLSFDSKMLITGSKDGSIAFWNLRVKSAKSGHSSEGTGLLEYLVQKSDWDSKEESLERAVRKVDEVRLEAEFELKQRKQEIDRELIMLKADHEEQLLKEKQSLEDLRNEFDAFKTEAAVKLATTVTKLESELKQSTDRDEARLVLAYEKTSHAQRQFENLKSEYGRYQTESEEKITAIEEEYKNEMERVQEEHKKAVKQETQKYLSHLAICTITQHASDQKEQPTDDSKSAVENLQKNLEEEIEKNLRLRGEGGYLKKKVASLEQSLESRKKLIANLNMECLRLQSVVNSCEKEIERLKEEIGFRDKLIHEKDSTISLWRSHFTTQEEALASLKDVVEGTKRELADRASVADLLEENVKVVKSDLLESEKRLKQQMERNGILERKFQQLKNELRAEKETNKDLVRTVDDLENEFDLICSHIAEPRSLQAIIREIRVNRDQKESRRRPSLSRNATEDGSSGDSIATKVIQNLKKTLKQEKAKHESEKKRLLQVTDFLTEVCKLCSPDGIWICDGSEEESKTFVQFMLDQKLLVPLPKYENCWLACTDPRDVARVESKTFICTEEKREAVPEPQPGVKGTLGNWMSLKQLDEEIRERFPGCMKGRTAYLVPFCMGPLNSPVSRIGIQVTDSVYVAACMRIMTRMGIVALEQLKDGDFVKCVHSVGAPLPLKEPLRNNWPCNPEKTMVAHKTKTNEIWSYGSGYGGNSLLGKKCFSLRIGSAIARREGWLAEHMLIVGITNPDGVKKYVVGAFPSQCGKTNLAMLTPPLPGYKIECVGDDIAWMRFDENGVLRAVNPEKGFFGVCPGTNHHTNPVAMDMVFRNTIFTNVAKTSDGGVFWEGLEKELNPNVSITSWLGEKHWTRDSGRPAAHPNSRFCTPLQECPILDPLWDSPEGVPISAILFGGRRPEGIPLVYEARSWQHGVFVGASVSSEATSAAEYKGHNVMHDPFSARPFLSYNAGKYFEHWLDMEKPGRKMPKIFHVNWFRKDSQGHYVWPGFGENIRVLDWIMRRCEEEPIAEESPIGLLPKKGSINLDQLPHPVEWEELFGLPKEFWLGEMENIESYFKEQIGEDLPLAIAEEIKLQKERLEMLS